MGSSTCIGLLDERVGVLGMTLPHKITPKFVKLTWVSKVYIALNLFAPTPRLPRRSEKLFTTVLPDGSRSDSKPLPCWLDRWTAEKEAAKEEAAKQPGSKVIVPPQMPIEEPELFMSVVVPAYNEEERLEDMLEEAVDFLQKEYGSAHDGEKGTGKQKGWEILIVSDGSKDATVDKALDFAKEHQLSHHPVPTPGPWSKNGNAKVPHSTNIPHGSIRVITLEQNRGKGGAVTHGMRHVRGQYIVFADADGASRFDDLGKMVEGCRSVEDDQGRGVAIGSRAHLVGSEAVVKVYQHLSGGALTYANQYPALQTPQLPHALLPRIPPCHDAARDRPHQRHAVRIQALLSTNSTLHYTVHALRRLDLRRGDADVG